MATTIPPELHTAEYSRKRLAEIRARHYPHIDDFQLHADLEWLTDEVEHLRGKLEKLPRW